MPATFILEHTPDIRERLLADRYFARSTAMLLAVRLAAAFTHVGLRGELDPGIMGVEKLDDRIVPYLDHDSEDGKLVLRCCREASLVQMELSLDGNQSDRDVVHLLVDFLFPYGSKPKSIFLTFGFSVATGQCLTARQEVVA